MLILVVNCGSSSAKYELFNVEKETSLCRGAVERIGEQTSWMVYHPSGKDQTKQKTVCPDHHRAIELIRDTLVDAQKGVLKDVMDVMGVGHRVVHGGEEFNQSTLIDAKVMKSIEKFSALAPLHNPPAIEGIKGCMRIFQGVPQVAVFDTAFHQTMPEQAFAYGIPYKFYKKYSIRKYGFHGTSHRYISMKAAELLGCPVQDVNVISVHLGNGCSIAAVAGGKSIDTSMGFTPLEGLLMGTRSGDMDPAVVTFLMRAENIGPEEMDGIMNKKSGLLGISGISNDMRDILSGLQEGNARARLAYDVFVYRIKKYIGAYAAVLGKVDAVVFAGGIGENVPEIKSEIKRHLRPMLGSACEFLTVRTNEELLIAKDTYNLVKRSA
ncbi:MAG: acetate kinase [Candidatus Omnitrophica bacterium]|nr:acetate kinase [Candidatus Omnitrophota bacterium]MDD4013702.1 acetate kinase [Candidatus Omnitrophota bacterium]